MKARWLPIAERDFEEHLLYVAGRSPRAAIDMGDAIEGAIGRLVAYPNVGRIGRVEGARELVVVGTPYVVIYRVVAKAILVLRVLHGAQRWPGVPG